MDKRSSLATGVAALLLSFLAPSLARAVPNHFSVQGVLRDRRGQAAEPDGGRHRHALRRADRRATCSPGPYGPTRRWRRTACSRSTLADDTLRDQARRRDRTCGSRWWWATRCSRASRSRRRSTRSWRGTAEQADALSAACSGCVDDAKIGGVAGAKVTGKVAAAAQRRHRHQRRRTRRAAYGNPSWITSLDGSKVTGTLTTRERAGRRTSPARCRGDERRHGHQRRLLDGELHRPAVARSLAGSKISGPWPTRPPRSTSPAPLAGDVDRARRARTQSSAHPRQADRRTPRRPTSRCSSTTRPSGQWTLRGRRQLGRHRHQRQRGRGPHRRHRSPAAARSPSRPAASPTRCCQSPSLDGRRGRGPLRRRPGRARRQPHARQHRRARGAAPRRRSPRRAGRTRRCRSARSASPTAAPGSPAAPTSAGQFLRSSAARRVGHRHHRRRPTCRASPAATSTSRRTRRSAGTKTFTSARSPATSPATPARSPTASTPPAATPTRRGSRRSRAARSCGPSPVVGRRSPAALAGDVTGTQSATSVVGLRGKPVALTAPIDQQVLQYERDAAASGRPDHAQHPGRHGHVGRRRRRPQRRTDHRRAARVASPPAASPTRCSRTPRSPSPRAAGSRAAATVALGGTVTLNNGGVLAVERRSAPLSSTGGQNPTLSLGTVGVGSGGTGLAVGPSAANQFLRANASGTAWSIGTLQRGRRAEPLGQLRRPHERADDRRQQDLQRARSAASISGNAARSRTALYTTGSYADPTWLTSLDGQQDQRAPSPARPAPARRRASPAASGRRDRRPGEPRIVVGLRGKPLSTTAPDRPAGAALRRDQRSVDRGHAAGGERGHASPPSTPGAGLVGGPITVGGHDLDRARRRHQRDARPSRR